MSTLWSATSKNSTSYASQTSGGQTWLMGQTTVTMGGPTESFTGQIIRMGIIGTATIFTAITRSISSWANQSIS